MKMKNTFLIPVYACFCTAFVIPKIPCQIITTPIALGIARVASVSPDQNSAMPSNTRGVYRNDISIRAVRDFIREFKDAKNVTWCKAKDGGFTARFINDSIQTMVSYNHKGGCIYTSRKYAENRMPAQVRSAINSAFSGFAIIQVMEMNVSPGIENIFYSVLINYVNNYKILKISKGQMEIVSDYSLK